MPPRKSTTQPGSKSPSGGAGDASILSATTEPTSPVAQKGGRQSTGGDAEGEKPERKKAKNNDVDIDDLLLPRTLTSRLSRGTLPANTSIQRDALLALTKSATVFISYLAHNANTLTSRKTIQSQDVLEALHETELWNVPIGNGVTLGERVRAEVEKWEGEVRGKRKGYRDRVKARESTGAVDADADADAEVGVGVGGEEQTQDGEGRGPVTKRARRSSNPEADVIMMGYEESEDEEETDAAAAQLRGDGAAVNEDSTETDPEIAEDDDDDEQDEEVDEDEQDEEVQEDDEENDERDKLEIDDSRRTTMLAPNGRWEEDDRDDSD